VCRISSSPLASLEHLSGIQRANLGGGQGDDDRSIPGRRSKAYAKRPAAFEAVDHFPHVALLQMLSGDVLIENHLFSHRPRPRREEPAGITSPYTL